MKQPMTAALIGEHLGKDAIIRSRLLGGWQVKLPSGASVKITQKRIDFGKYQFIEKRGGIDEARFQAEGWKCMALASEVWEGIGACGRVSQEDRVSFLTILEAAGFKTGVQGSVLRHFGPEATIKYTWFGCKIRLPDGSGVEVSGGGIEEVMGDADIFRAALRFHYDLTPDNVVVRGSQELILAGLQHGASLGIEVIPESIPQGKYGLISAVVQLICIVIAAHWLDLLPACAVGWGAGVFLCLVANRLFWKQMRADWRRRGQKLKSKWPSVHGGERKAQLEDARSKGMV